MNPSHFLWLDYRSKPSSPSLFHRLQPFWSVERCVRPVDTFVPIRDCQPHFLCFEFDTPSATELAALESTHLRHPGMPILMITEDVPCCGTESVFQRGVWDFLELPVSATDLNATVEAFAHFCQRRHHKGAATSAGHQPLDWPRTQAARDFVTMHLGEEVRLRQLADLCHLSESEFSRSFKKENGSTFSDFVLQLRIRRACELLSDRRIQVKCVAFEVGFNDESYFARAFRRCIGVTPSRYQQTHAQGLQNPMGSRGASPETSSLN